MKLSVLERLLLLRLLPGKGNLTDLRIIRDMQDRLSFSEEEHEALNFQSDGRAMRWNTEADLMEDVQFGPRARKIVWNQLHAAEQRGEEFDFAIMRLCDEFDYPGDKAENDDGSD